MRTPTWVFLSGKETTERGRGQKATPCRPQARECVVIAPPSLFLFRPPRNTPPHASPYNPAGAQCGQGCDPMNLCPRL